MHGELKKLRCLENEHLLETSEVQDFDQICPTCQSYLRPNIVWFGEMPFYMEKLQRLISECTHFIYCGTSSLVYPAAGFKQLAKMAGAKVLCINLDIPNFDPDTDLFLKGKSSQLLPQILDVLN
jgi:NAD-dependent deacetylase